MTDDRALSAELLQEYAEHSPYRGVLAQPTFKVVGGNPACGDRIELGVEIDGETVKSARFLAAGCIISKASAGLMAELIDNKPVAHVLGLTIKELEAGLGSDFRSRIKCVLLPLFVLQEGLKKYRAAPTPGATYEVSAPRNLGL